MNVRTQTNNRKQIMSRYIPQTCSESKTYATEAAAVKRAEALSSNLSGVTYIIMLADNGRFVPVFIGNSAVAAGLHFQAHVLN